MNKKLLITIFVGVIIVIGVWIYFLIGLLGNSNTKIDYSANILSGTITENSNLTLTGIANNVNTGTTSIGNDNIVYLHIPKIFDNFNFKKFKIRFEETTNIKLLVKTYEDINLYSKYLSANLKVGGTNLDIFLIPSNWLDTYSEYALKLGFNNDFSVIFNRVFFDLINNPLYTFIPYSIDPFVTITNGNNITYDKNLTLNRLKESMLISNANSSNKNNIKLLFGISALDIGRLEQGKETFDDYFLILYNFLFQSNLISSGKIITSLLDFGDEKSFNVWDSKKHFTLSRTLIKKNDKCEIYSRVCFISYGFTDIIFGFLSDLDVFQSYFQDSSKLSISDLELNNFIHESQSYLVRGWGFLVNKNSKSLNNVGKFINSYIQEGVSGNSLLWTNTLSAFNKVYEKQRINRKYRYIIDYENDYYLMKGGIDILNNFLEKTQMIQALKGNYNIELFLEKLGYDWKF